MDPLSLSASIAGLISITDTIARGSYKYIKEARCASNDVKKLLEEITDLFGVLSSLRLVASRYQDEDFDSTMQSQYIYTCQMLLEKIQVRLDKADPSQVDERKSPFRQKASSLGRSLIWPFSIAETKGLISEVANQKATLSLALAADGMNALINSLSLQKAQGEDITEIRDNIRAQIAEQAMSLLSDERKKILHTIGPFDPSGHQNVAIKLRQPGTGVWFIEGPQFKHWFETPNAKLWLYGIPGAGKTVLTSSMIQATMNQSDSADGVAYFYCDYKDSRTQEPLVILGALVRQLAIQDSRSLEALEKFYANYYPESGSRGGTPLVPEDLCSLIRNMSAFFDEVMIIVDALDECSNDRSNIVELLASLNADGSNIKTLFTSRLETDIELHLGSYEKISIAATSSDLKLYVASEIESRSRKRLLRTRDPELRKEIMDRLVNGAEGMFRWVTCQLDYLCELNTDKAIRKALTSLPPTLFATYERILDRVNSSNADTQQLVQRVLTWIVCSTSPLNTRELLEALSITEGDTQLDLDAKPDEEGILKWCSSLVRKTPDGMRLELAHFTVEEFLLAIDSKKPNNPYLRYKINFGDQNLQLAKLCLTYLLLDDFRIKESAVEEDPDAFLEEYCFYRYATDNWVKHTFSCREDADLVDLMETLFDPSKSGNFLCWSRCWMWRSNFDDQECEIFDAETLHFAAFLLLDDICEWLVNEKARISDLDKISSIGTPLYCALSARASFFSTNVGHSDVLMYKEAKSWTFECLLDAGAKMDIRIHPKVDRTLLASSLKADFGWQMLLSRGVILDDSTLEVAEELSRRGEGLGEQFLLEVSDQNLDENIRLKYVKLALQMNRSREHVVTMMSKASGADEEISTETSSALCRAAETGQIGVVQELLDKPGVSINFRAPTSNNRTALHCASRHGHFEVVKLLVQHEASLEVKDNQGMTPLLEAAMGGNLNVFNLLEESGSNVNAVSGDGSTVLHIAAACNSYFILNHLVHLPNITHTLTTKTENGRTPLLCAVQAGSIDTARFILDRSSLSEILSRTNDGHTCLHYAVLSRKPKMISLLQDTGICHHDQTSEGLTALHYTSLAGTGKSGNMFDPMMDYIERASLITEDIMALPTLINARAHLQYPDGRWDIDDFVSGRRLDTPTKSGKTALQLLVSAAPFPYRNETYIEGLISRGGIDLERRDKGKKTPLIILASRFARVASPQHAGFSKAIRHLIDGGADPNAQDILGRTALHYLCDSTGTDTNIYQAIIHLLGIEELLPEILPSFPFKPPKIFPRRIHPTRVDIRDVNGETALAALFRNMSEAQNTSHATDIAVALLGMSTKAELDRQLPDGNRLFCLAIAKGNDRLIKELYRLGADTQARDGASNRRSPLEQFCVSGVRNPEILRELIKRCKDLAEHDLRGKGLLHLACQSGHLTVVEELVDGGLDINLKSSEKGTALSHSAYWGHTPIVQYLLDYGARIDECGSDGQPLLASPVSCISNVAICRLLEDRGIKNWTERTYSGFNGIFVPGFTTTKAGPATTNIWHSPLVHRLTPFHWFAYRGLVDVFEYIVEHDKEVDIDIEAEFGIRPLFMAIFTGHYAVAKFLLEKGANPNGVFKPTEWTMLHLASHFGELQIIRILLTSGANPWAKDKSGIIPSIIAVQQGHSVIARELEEAEKLWPFEADKQFTDTPTDKISPALSDAITKGDMKVCQSLIGRGFSFDGTCECGCTALLKALVQRQKDVAKYLLKMGASVDGVACSKEGLASGLSLLHLASLEGDLETLQVVLRQSSVSNTFKIQPIHLAARNGSPEILRFLVECAEDKTSLLEAKTPKRADYSNFEGFRNLLENAGQAGPLHIAVRFVRVEAAEYLLRAGADLEARDERGQTAMHIGVSIRPDKEVLELLIKAGACLNVRDYEGRTPLMIALESNRQGLVEDLMALVPVGLDIYATDISGKTALHHAIQFGQDDNAKLLIEAGLSTASMDLFERSPLTVALHEEFGPVRINKFVEVDTGRSKIHGSHLNVASFTGHESVVVELLKRAPEQNMNEYINLKCELGTPLYSAASRGHIPIMEKLLEKGADINLVGGSAGTPLMGACAMGHIEAVRFLLGKGAELQCTKLDGSTITAEEAAQHHENVVALLRTFKQSGLNALDKDFSVKTADISKLDEFMAGYRERKEKRAKKDDHKDTKAEDGKKSKLRDDTNYEVTADESL